MKVEKLVRFLIATLVGSATPFVTASIGTLPDCPSVLDPVVIVGRGPTLRSEPLQLEVHGSTIKLVAQTWRSAISLPPATEVRGTLPPMPAGAYRIEFYTRGYADGSYDGDPSKLLPEVFLEARDLVVYDGPPRCSPSKVEVVGANFTSAPLGAAYPVTFRVRVTDAHEWAIPGAELMLSRVAAPDEAGTLLPDMAAPMSRVLTDQDGVAAITATSNGLPGAFQYRVRIPALYEDPTAFVIFYNEPSGSSRPDYPVAEFQRYVSGRPHFFMTGDPQEMAKLDRTTDWRRTGAIFMAFAPTSHTTGMSAVCRFYGLPAAGLDSHFFSAASDECVAVAQRFGNAWKLETSDAFQVYLPDQESGACPPTTRRLFRAYNNQPDANHRYALSPATAVNPYTNGPGWTLEGYGNEAVVMCLPQ